ncbi:MAG: type II toxin-antitoxin system PemK/MazF family toxin [Dermatophilaceae bacterium]|nr:type II toxin-antitoxin system PemK/MazF family toxin [Dermatophilaceae bacterium]MBP9917003.1 type II toxin-antitoxin system PemK/MazF family toxin [Dermatophilaceae bacterium]
MRGDVHEITIPGGRGHAQTGRRYAVVLQSDDLPLSTVIVAPTSTSARPTSFRPEVVVLGQRTLVLVEQCAAVDHQKLGRRVGGLTHPELTEVDDALRLVLALDR